MSLQDVFGRVEGAFDTYFTESKPTGKEVVFAAEDDFEAAEMVQNGHIDLGEVVAQYLALELEPYPRAPGVSLPAQVTVGDDGDKDKKHNPFKVLEGLKK